MISKSRKSMDVWETALYVRLSQDDKEKSISNSVINQQNMLKEFAEKDEEFKIVDCYIDDGYTGTNFNRPGFIRMMEDMKRGRLNCIIVKDLSRFGREHIDVDNYLERIFPLMNVRFISVMQNLDSYKNPAKMNSIEIPFLNLINEEYARDISRKTKASLESKRKEGKYISSLTPYGYLKDPLDKNHLIIDEEAAINIEKIFNWFVNGMDYSEIKNKLNDMKSLNPAAYRTSKKAENNKINSGYAGLWETRHIRQILNTDLYTGDMVQGKTATYNHKTKKRIPLPKEEWIVVPSTHDPIVTHSTFEAAQALQEKKTRPRVKKMAPSPLSRYIKCGDCGEPMVRTTCTHNGRKYKKYVCSLSKKYGSKICGTHIIDEDVLLEIILNSIQKQIKCAVDIEKTIKKAQHSKITERNTAFLERKVSKIEKEINRVTTLKQGLYEDCKSGLITEDEYSQMKSSYEDSNRELSIELLNIKRQITEVSDQKIEDSIFITTFKRFNNINEITRDIVTALIEEIIVFEERQITIKFKYRDEYKKLTSIFASEVKS